MSFLRESKARASYLRQASTLESQIATPSEVLRMAHIIAGLDCQLWLPADLASSSSCNIQ
jgi:hypothetical protein